MAQLTDAAGEVTHEEEAWVEFWLRAGAERRVVVERRIAETMPRWSRNGLSETMRGERACA